MDGCSRIDEKCQGEFVGVLSCLQVLFFQKHGINRLYTYQPQTYAFCTLHLLLCLHVSIKSLYFDLYFPTTIYHFHLIAIATSNDFLRYPSFFQIHQPHFIANRYYALTSHKQGSLVQSHTHIHCPSSFKHLLVVEKVHPFIANRKYNLDEAIFIKNW